MVVKEAIKLEYKMNKGEDYIYRVTVKSQRRLEEAGQIQEEKDQIIMKMVQKVVDVKPDGSYNLEMIVEPQQLIRNDKEVPLDTPAQSVTMRMTRNGEILETSMPSPATQPSFPTKTLFVGDSWVGESKVSLPERPQPIILKFNYLLWGIERVKGYECAQINVSSPETKIELAEGVSQRISAAGTTYFAHNEGRLVRSEVETKISIKMPEGKVYNSISIFVDILEAPTAVKKKELPSEDEFFISG